MIRKLQTQLRNEEMALVLLKKIRQSQLLAEAAKAAELAEERKLAHYDELSAQYIITPVGNETLGSWGSRSLKFIQELGQRICEATTGEKRSTSYLFQSLSIATQRGNIASIRGSLPDIKTLHEIYYL